MKSKEEILRTKVTSYAPIEGREFSLNEVLKAMDEYANEIRTEQNSHKHNVSGKRPDCPYCMESISERMIEEWTNWLRNAKAACASGAVDTVAAGGHNPEICGCESDSYYCPYNPDSPNYARKSSEGQS